MSNLRAILRLNQAVYSSFTCCSSRARCRPRLIFSLSNPIQNPNSSKPRLIDSSNVKKMETLSWGGSRNHRRRMLAANWTDEKSPYNTLENMLDKQIAESESDDADSYKAVVLTENMQQDKQIETETETETDDVYSYKPRLYKPVLTENMQQDKQVAAETDDEVESNNSKTIRKMEIYCSDGISIDGEPFKRESLVVQNHCKFGFAYVENLKGNSELLLKVQFYCAERAKIQDNYSDDETVLRQKLDDFNSSFRQENRIYALDLMTAAFELEIRSLVDVLMDDVIDVFLKMTDDEAYKILYVNLRDEFSHKVYKEYSNRVMFHRWAFE
ncbi:uncharacterized protein [Rutidosis leptorrhynchoides]|uniref:uncharacterized protein isoform X2 n=1 Tax=Rutidosis leptorrhynchoides TaxID=125765 RepID=UPI003A992F9F